MYDLVVIGTGPGGYHAAIRAAQLGLEVLAVEADAVGGVCLNVGCIPTKALLHAAAQIEHARRAADFGLDFRAPQIDLGRLAAWRDGIVERLTRGVSGLLRGRDVELRRGRARFVDANTIEVSGERIEAKHFIIATGSAPMALEGFGVDDEAIVDSSAALHLELGVPRRFLAIGGGAVGLEFASIMNRFGAKVTVAEYMPGILPGSDREMAMHYARILARQGIGIRTGTRVTGLERRTDGLHVSLESADGERSDSIVVDRILVAIGRRPRSDGLGLGMAGVECDSHGFIVVDEGLRTSVPHIYAIGDVARPPLLAHKAMKEGLVAACNAAGGDAVFDYQVANVVYTEPEWASVGMTENEARERGIEVKVGRFPLAASGRAMTLADTDGLFKVVGDAETDLLLGVHIVAPNASELIAEATLALEMAATVTDLKWTVHPHPTLSEGIMEAAEQLYGEVIHLPK